MFALMLTIICVYNMFSYITTVIIILRGVKMVEKFNKELIIYYKKNRFGKIYKRVINKLDNGKFSVSTYYKENAVNRIHTSKINFNKEQIEKLIDSYLKQYNIEKTVIYK